MEPQILFPSGKTVMTKVEAEQLHLNFVQRHYSMTPQLKPWYTNLQLYKRFKIGIGVSNLICLWGLKNCSATSRNPLCLLYTYLLLLVIICVTQRKILYVVNNLPPLQHVKIIHHLKKQYHISDRLCPFSTSTFWIQVSLHRRIHI